MIADSQLLHHLHQSTRAWRHWVISLMLLCCVWPAVTAQDFAFTEPQFDNVGDAEAIPAAVVTALAQDARGLIWIGTQQGLVRYDGYRFRKFLHQASEPFSLAGDYVNALWAAPDGRLWIGTGADGLSVYDPASDHFDNFRHDARQPGSIAAGQIWALVGDARGGMWLATDQGLDYLAHGARSFTHFRVDAANPAGSLLADKILCLLIDRQQRLWVGSNKGLQRLASDGRQFETISAGQEIRSLFEAKDGKLWLGSYKHGAAWLDPASGATPPLHWLGPDKLSHPWIEGIAQVQGDQIWLASYGGGINIVAASDGRVLQQLRHDATLGSSLGLDSVKPLMLDRAGWLWVGTWGGGLQRFNTNNRMLRVLRHSPTRPRGLSHPEILSVLELQNGEIWLGTSGNGIDIIDRKQGLKGGHRAGAKALPDVAITALAQSRDGAVWAGSQQAGVVRQSAPGQVWQAIPGLASESVLRLLASRDGSVWAGTNSGVARCLPGAARFEAIKDSRGQPMPSAVSTLAEDQQGRIWIGTDDGLWLQEPGARGLIAIHAAPERSDGLVSDSIIGLLLDRQARLWLATDKGLERLLSWDGKTARFEHISARLGFPGKALGGNLMEDGAGRIWTSDVVIDPAKLRMQAITRADGMDIGATWNGSFAQSRDGLLFFGGSQGLAIIDPARFVFWDYAPPLVALELKVNGRAAALGPLAALVAGDKAGDTAGKTAGNTAGNTANATLAPLTFSPEQRNFALEFSALDFSEPRSNRYQYRLLGYDKDWISADFEHRSASYGNLWPGEYTLQVRGSNRLGEFSQHQLSVPIKVLPAWWQTWWCWSLALLSIIGSVGGFYYWRVTRLRNIIRLRTAAIAHAHDTLASTHQQLEAAHGELAAAHQHLKETQTKLVQSEKMASLGGLVAGIAHEINTPLGTTLVALSGVSNVLHGVRDAIRDNSLSKSQLDGASCEALEYTDLALRSATRAADLVATFKTIAVREDNEQSLEIELGHYLEDSLSLIRPRLEQAGHQLELDLPSALHLQLVPDALQEALSRVYANVLDHAFAPGQPGVMRVAARLQPDGTLDIVVSDNGCGISVAALPKVFDPFFTTRSGVGGHVGLGLHVAFNHVTQRLKGEISIASSDSGSDRGTKVTIRIKPFGLLKKDNIGG